MGTIRISGASDDLICIEGAIDDEGSGPGFVEVSTGDVFEVTYDDSGCWNVAHHVSRGDAEVHIVTKDEEDDDGYSGHATLSADLVEWVDFWDSWPPEDEQMRERLGERLDDLDGPALSAAYRAAMRKG